MLTSLDRTDQQNVGGRIQVAAGGEFVDELAVHPGGGVDVEAVQGGGGGRSPRARMLRVRLGYDSVNPSPSSSSHSVRAHKCGSSRSRALA